MRPTAVTAVTAVTVLLAFALGTAAVVHPTPVARADTCSDSVGGTPLPVDSCSDVLAQEARWLKAITDGDRATIDSILSANFKHITSQGVLLDRAQEIAGIIKEPFTMNPTEQIVDIAGDTAVIHGVNTLIQSGRVLAKERFTDVFVLQNGAWMALSAQETAV
jgi:uncharacterized protein DUF4440